MVGTGEAEGDEVAVAPGGGVTRDAPAHPTTRSAAATVRAVSRPCTSLRRSGSHHGSGPARTLLRRAYPTPCYGPRVDPADRAPMTEEEIRAAVVGELKPLEGPILLADYDPAWPALFEREAARIRAALGDDARLVEHAGSTSVPGLAAKPIIDIVLAVPDSADEASYVPALEAAGYVLRIREPEWLQHRVLKGPDTNVNLHVFTVGTAEIERMLLFRDWLRAHPADRDLYLQTKRELVARDWHYVQNYADAKTAVIDEVVGRARAASAAGSRPRTGDV